MNLKYTFLTFFTCLGISNSSMAQVPSYVPKNGLVGWWPFAGNANDQSGNGNNFTVNTATLTTDRNGISNSAYVFNGSSDYLVNNSLSNTFSDTGDFTVATWIQKTSIAAGVAIMSGTPNSSYFIWLIQGGTSDMSFGTNKQSSSWFYAKSTFNVNDWDHYVGVYHKDTMLFYKNGSKVATNIFTYTSVLQSAFPLYIGRGVSGNYYEGKVDDIGIWKRALTDNEIILIYKTKCDTIIKSPPTSQKLRISGYAKFTIVANTANYQWQKNSGSGFQNISNGGQFSGATTKILNVFNLSLSNNNQQFRCIASNGTCADTSKIATLTVCGDITQQPKNQSIIIFSNAKFVVVSNEKSASFQWQYNGGSGFKNISNSTQFNGANNDTLDILNCSLSNNGQLFRCVVNQGSCVDTSQTAILNVCGKINEQPKDQSIFLNGTAQFSISSTDFSAAFQWQINTGSGFQTISNTGKYSGATTKLLTVSSALITNNNQLFRCIVKHGACTDTSLSATLYVCGKITLQPKNQTIFLNKNALFITTSNDLSATFQWQINAGFGFQNVTNSGQFKGANNDTLIVSDANMFNNKNTVHCIVSQGACIDTTSSAILKVCGEIVVQPIDQSVKLTKTAVFSTSSNDQYATYQWQVDTGLGFINVMNSGQFNGASSDKLTISKAVILNNNIRLHCIVNHGSCIDTSAAGRLLVCGEITDNPANQTVYISNNAEFKVISNDIKATFQWQSNTGTGFQNLINGGKYNGATANKLLISGTTLSNNNEKLRCAVHSGSCRDTSLEAILTVKDKSGIKNEMKQPLFKVYPNPISEFITIQIDTKLIGSIYFLYNQLGICILSGELRSEKTCVKTGHITAGLYLLQIGNITEQSVRIVKF